MNFSLTTLLMFGKKCGSRTQQAVFDPVFPVTVKLLGSVTRNNLTVFLIEGFFPNKSKDTRSYDNLYQQYLEILTSRD